MGVWQENSFPEEGVEVILTDLYKKTAGWRARKARFLRPEDEKEKDQKYVIYVCRKGWESETKHPIMTIEVSEEVVMQLCKTTLEELSKK